MALPRKKRKPVQYLAKHTAPPPGPGPGIRAILIDPFQCVFIELEGMPANPTFKCHLLDCESLSVVDCDDKQHVLWLDAAGDLREPFVYPRFRTKLLDDGETQVSGYGLFTGGWGIDEPHADCTIDLGVLRGAVAFERWQKRIDPSLVIRQVFRSYNGKAEDL